jgi:hypothetical protein
MKLGAEMREVTLEVPMDRTVIQAEAGPKSLVLIGNAPAPMCSAYGGRGDRRSIFDKTTWTKPSWFGRPALHGV